MAKTKSAGYIRVSSAQQIEGESLRTQRTKIKKESKANDYKLTNIYADEGISGGTVKERNALQNALQDAQNGTFKVLIVNDLSRFGRNARELLENHEELERAGVELKSIKEGINFGSAIGKAMLTMLAAIAELELSMIKERMLENRISKAQRGIPTSGRLPFGRTFDKDKEQWGVEAEAKKAIQWVAEKFLNGESLQDIALQANQRFDYPLSYSNTLKVLKDYSGDQWTIQFDGHQPITYNIPRLLPNSTIQKIKDRLAHNRKDNRTDSTNSYLLTGFIRCMHCKKSLSGQIQKHGNKEYGYYIHPGKKTEKCHAFRTVPLHKIEDAIMKTIYENIADMPSFNKAIAESLPDDKMIQELKDNIKSTKLQIKNIDKKLSNLVDAVADGTINKETIRAKEQKLTNGKELAQDDVNNYQTKLNKLPNPQQVKQDAERIRTDLLKYYHSKEHFAQMDFPHKKQLLHFLFDGKAPNGDQYGIYVDKKDNGEIDYFMFGRLTGIRTIKGNNINYMGDDADTNDGKITQQQQEQAFIERFQHKKKLRQELQDTGDYKTELSTLERTRK